MGEIKQAIRDYGHPVPLIAAECQYAILDGPDGAPVAYVYREEEAKLFTAAPQMKDYVETQATLGCEDAIRLLRIIKKVATR